MTKVVNGRVLLVSQNGGGTVPPMLALAQSLVARGHDVTVLGQLSIRQRAMAAGGHFVPFTTLPDYEIDKVIEDQLQLAMQVIAGNGAGDDLLATAEEHRSDVVVIDCTLAGASAAAEKLGRPSVMLLHSMYKTRVDTWFAELWPLLAGVVNATRSSYGLDEASSWTDILATRPDVLGSPKDFRCTSRKRTADDAPLRLPRAGGQRNRARVNVPGWEREVCARQLEYDLSASGAAIADYRRCAPGPYPV